MRYIIIVEETCTVKRWLNASAIEYQFRSACTVHTGSSKSILFAFGKFSVSPKFISSHNSIDCLTFRNRQLKLQFSETKKKKKIFVFMTSAKQELGLESRSLYPFGALWIYQIPSAKFYFFRKNLVVKNKTDLKYMRKKCEKKFLKDTSLQPDCLKCLKWLPIKSAV